MREFDERERDQLKRIDPLIYINFGGSMGEVHCKAFKNTLIKIITHSRILIAQHFSVTFVEKIKKKLLCTFKFSYFNFNLPRSPNQSFKIPIARLKIKSKKLKEKVSKKSKKEEFR